MGKSAPYSDFTNYPQFLPTSLFVVYLASHNRPIHEVLFSTRFDIENEYKSHFLGMAEVDVPLETLTHTRETLFDTVHKSLTENHKQFLISLASAEPEWSLINVQHLPEMPGIKWKIQNLKLLTEINPEKFAQHVEILKSKLSSIRSVDESA